MQGMSLYSMAKAAELGQHADQLFAHEREALAHHEDVGVVADIAAGDAQMDDARRLRALLAVGVDMAHHVVAHELFARGGDLVVDVVRVRLELRDHIGRDVFEALVHLRAASATHRRRQVRNLLSSEKMYCISSEA
jgi:hypothetical protein